MAGGGETSTTTEPLGYLKKPSKEILNWLQSQDLLNRPYPSTTSTERFAPYTPEEQAARTMTTDTLGSWRPFMGLGALDVLAPTDLNAFANPYTDTVVQNRLQDLSRGYQQQRNRETARAFSQQALGPESARAALPTLRAYSEAIGQTSGNLRQTDFTSAAEAALQGQRQTQEAGRSLAQIASDTARLNQADIAGLQQAGAYARQLPQAMKDFAYQQKWDQFNFPWNQALQYANVLGALPQGYTQTTAMPGTSTGQMVAGGLSLLGAIAAPFTGGASLLLTAPAAAGASGMYG